MKELPPNTTLSHYRIVSKIGEGGMGEVFLAVDTKLERKVAIKFLAAEFSRDEERLRRFVQEAKAASALNHPNILTIHEIGEADGTRYIASEYIEGATLRNRLEIGSLPVDETLRISVQVGEALAASHAAGIVHRDIKPENIMVRSDGYVKVVDFGLAKLTEGRAPLFDSEAETRKQVHTRTGVIMGTASYMSPEQARGKEIDARTDIWSFGVVLYEMLERRLPFDGETQNDYLAAILKSEPNPFESEQVSDELKRAVHKALRKDRDARYQTMKGMLADLKEFSEEMSFSEKLDRIAAPSKKQTSTTLAEIRTGQSASKSDRITNKIRNHKAAFLASLVVLLLAIGGLNFWYFSNPSASTRQVNSIAVLPLENLSGDPAEDYFADGMTEALINNLAQIRAFSRVISRTSVMRYKGSGKSLKEIAQELNVDAVIEGTVQRSDGRVRVTARLIPAATDSPLWARDYERDLSDVLKLQSDLARAVADEIRIHVTPEEQARLASARRINPQAHEAYLLGRYHFSKNNEKDYKQALVHFERATQIAPDYARAYAGLSDVWRELGVLGVIPFKETAEPARAAAWKAIGLDDQLAEGHISLAVSKAYYDWDWTGAEQAFRRALELDPRNVQAHRSYGRLLMCLGRHDESVEEGRIGLELDPLSAEAQTDMGRFLYRARRYTEALPHLQRAVEMEPRSVDANFRLGDIYIQLGRYSEAITVFEKGQELTRNESFFKVGIARAFALMGRESEARRLISEVKGQNLYVAGVYAALNDKDEAFRILGHAIDEGNTLISHLKEDPPLDNLRSDPRWNELLRRMNLPPE